jgi:hypothetical protein
LYPIGVHAPLGKSVQSQSERSPYPCGPACVLTFKSEHLSCCSSVPKPNLDPKAERLRLSRLLYLIFGLSVKTYLRKARKCLLQPLILNLFPLLIWPNSTIRPINIWSFWSPLDGRPDPLARIPACIRQGPSYLCAYKALF